MPESYATSYDYTPKLVALDSEPEKISEDIAAGSLIIGVHGPLGSGKTLLEYMMCKDLWAEGWNPHLNFEATVMPFRKIDFRELLVKALMAETFDDEPIIWGFDQIEDYMEARASMELSHQLYSYFIYQVRKRNHRLRYTSTTSYLNDWRLGSETEYSISAQKRHELNKSLCFTPHCKAKHFFRYFVVNNIRKKITKRFEVHNAEGYFEEYDSYELYKPYEAMTPGRIQKLLLSIGIPESTVQERLAQIEEEYRRDFPSHYQNIVSQKDSQESGNNKQQSIEQKPLSAQPPKAKLSPEEALALNKKQNMVRADVYKDREKWIQMFSSTKDEEESEMPV